MSPTHRFLSCLGTAALLALAPASARAAAEERVTTITCDGQADMVSNDTETTIVFQKNVEAVGTDLKLTCDYLKVVVLRKGEKTDTLGKMDKFRSMLAIGNVHFVQTDREAACGRAEILPLDDRVILTENPVIVDHDQNTRIAGEKITLLRGQRQVLVDKPQLSGPPVRDLGFDKAKAMAEPTPDKKS